MNWNRLLAYISGAVDQELLLRNEYLVTENRILRNQIKGRLRLIHPERIRLAEIGRRLGWKALTETAPIVRPETIVAWHRQLIARKFDGWGHAPDGRLRNASKSSVNWSEPERTTYRGFVEPHREIFELSS